VKLAGGVETRLAVPCEREHGSLSALSLPSCYVRSPLAKCVLPNALIHSLTAALEDVSAKMNLCLSAYDAFLHTHVGNVTFYCDGANTRKLQ
jgi:hypothetical protein